MTTTTSTSSTSSRTSTTGAIVDPTGGPRPADAPPVRAQRAALAEPGPARQDRSAVHLTRRGRLLVVLALVALMLASFAFGRSASQAAGQADRAAAPPPLAQLTVQEGDSLWSVARQVAPGRDVREVVDQLRDLNDLDGPVLLVGQQLLLPTSAEAW